MPRRTIRLTVDADERLQSAMKLRGYANPSTFLRAAMDHELKGRDVFAAERHELEAEWTITFRRQNSLSPSAATARSSTVFVRLASIWRPELTSLPLYQGLTGGGSGSRHFSRGASTRPNEGTFEDNLTQASQRLTLTVYDQGRGLS